MLTILGSAAGGGFPQWNCRSAVSGLAWSLDPRVRRRTQSSLALSNAAGEAVLINASPDLRQQILDTPALAPRPGRRESPIRAVVLTNADVDHIAGLLTLRERWPFRLIATADVLSSIAANPIFNVLAADLVERFPIALEQAFEPIPGVRLTLFAVPGKVPLWGEAGTVATDVEDGRTVGIVIRGDEAVGDAFYIPGCAAMTPALADRLRGAALVLFDGTLFDDDEMIRAGLGAKTGRRMGHMPVSGPGGSLEAFTSLDVRRKVYVHINNSNPMLIDGSDERRVVSAARWEVGEDGMEIALCAP
jgi:pyrroloquinoline quinone biosynthesis protein B